MLVPVIMHKSEKYRIREKKMLAATRVFFMQNFGCTRKVYNLYTDYLYNELEELGYTGGDVLPDIKLPEVTRFKKEYPYLKRADALGLCNAKQDFEDAIKHFNEDCDHKLYTKRAIRRNESGTEPLSFRGLTGMPKFHSKAQGYFSYTTNCQYPKEGNNLKRATIRLQGNTLYLPKLKDGVELIVHRKLPDNAVIGSVTISMDTDGAFYASIEYSYTVMMEMELRDAAISNNTEAIGSFRFLGLDYSQSDFYVDSEGRKANYPHCYRESEEKLARLQRELSHMVNDSSNYKKQLAKIRKLHVHIRNQRKDFIEKESTRLVSAYDVIVVEDLDLRALGQCLSLGKNLHDNGFGMFRNALARKLEQKGSVLVKIDKWYPSSKTCHCCGTKNDEVTLGVRKWVCQNCGAVLDRDENAAINIKAEGKRIFAEYFAAWLEKDQKARDKAEKLSSARKKKKAA